MEPWSEERRGRMGGEAGDEGEEGREGTALRGKAPLFVNPEREGTALRASPSTTPSTPPSQTEHSTPELPHFQQSTPSISLPLHVDERPSVRPASVQPPASVQRPSNTPLRQLRPSVRLPPSRSTSTKTLQLSPSVRPRPHAAKRISSCCARN